LFSSEVSFTQEMLLWEDGVARKLDFRNEPGHEAGDGEGDDDDAGDDGPREAREPPQLAAAKQAPR
jgi:hypothetical protein